MQSKQKYTNAKTFQFLITQLIWFINMSHLYKESLSSDYSSYGLLKRVNYNVFISAAIIVHSVCDNKETVFSITCYLLFIQCVLKK